MGFPGTPLHLSVSAAREELRASTKVQAAAYKVNCQALHPDSLEALLTRRIYIITEITSESLPHFDWPTIRSQLRQLRGHYATTILKTWLDGWATSERFHERHGHTCVFGCPRQRDTVAHSVSCPRLWRTVWKLTGAHRRRSPLQKLALAGDSSSLECFMQVYHCLRMGRLDLIVNRDIAQIAIEMRSFFATLITSCCV